MKPNLYLLDSISALLTLPNPSTKDELGCLDPRIRALQGKWSGSRFVDDNGQGHRNAMAIDGTQASFVMNTYADARCRSCVLSIELGGTFCVGPAIPEIEDAYEFDMIITTFEGTVSTRQMVWGANEEELFGFDDWESGVSKNLFGNLSVCDDGEPLDRGAMLYTLFKVDGNKLYFGGDDGPGFGGEARDRSLNLDEYMVRRP